MKPDLEYYLYLLEDGVNMQCALCNKWSRDLYLETIQLAGRFELMYVCPVCKAKREQELEMCRENYRRITEVKIER